MRLTWSRHRFGLGAYGARLKVNGDFVATVQPLGEGGYFWYARSAELGIPLRNTAGHGLLPLDAAKKQCEAFVRGCLAALGTGRAT